MDLQLNGKRALVTGSTAGIGKGIARLLAAEGASVVVHGRRKEPADQLVAELTAAGGRATAVLGDLTLDAQAARVADEAIAAFGGLDILVNNAGGIGTKPWADTSAEDWAHMLNADVISVVRLIRAVLPGMKQRGWGRLVQIASAAAVQPNPYGPDYCAGKAAIVNLTVSLARDLAGTGVTANTVSPGMVRTEGLEAGFRAHAQVRGWGDDWDAFTPKILAEIQPAQAGVGRVGRVEEIAAMVALVASPLGGFTNGANLRVDGGYVIGV